MRRHLAIVLLACTLPMTAADPAPRLDFGMLGELPGVVLHGAGQSSITEHATLAAALPADRQPCFHMTYTKLGDSPERMTKRTANWSRDLALLPADVGLNLGLSFTQDGKGKQAQYAEAIIAGEHDEAIATLARGLAALDRMIYARIGYECNGDWNGYQPQTYPQAFRHIAAILREHGQGRIATVWCVHPVSKLDRIMTFYPGDEWVDWWSIDLFEPHFVQRPVVRAFCHAAAEHRRPVLIGEATPSKVRGSPEQRWDRWYARIFELIRSEPSIKGFSYINRNWDASRWKWGDSRLHTQPLLLERYAAEMADPLYHHAQGENPTAWSLAPLTLDGERIERELVAIGSEAASVSVDPTPGAAFLLFAYRVVDADGAPTSAGEADLVVRDQDGTELKRTTRRARDHDDRLSVTLERDALVGVTALRFSSESQAGLHLALHSTDTPGGVAPSLLVGVPAQ